MISVPSWWVWLHIRPFNVSRSNRTIGRLSALGVLPNNTVELIYTLCFGTNLKKGREQMEKHHHYQNLTKALKYSYSNNYRGNILLLETAKQATI